jgi:hypothetical protein
MRRRVAQGLEVFAHGCPRKTVSRLYGGTQGRLNGAESLETGRDIVPAQRSLVE